MRNSRPVRSYLESLSGSGLAATITTAGPVPHYFTEAERSFRSYILMYSRYFGYPSSLRYFSYSGGWLSIAS